VEPFLLDKPFQEGLRAKAQASKAGPGLVVCRNAVPTPDGAVPALTGLTSLPGALTTEIFTTLGVTRAFPSPQILRGRAKTFLCLPTALYTLNETTWASTALRPISTTPTNLLTNGSLETSMTGWSGAASWEWQYEPETLPAFKGHLRHISGAVAASQSSVVTSGHTYYVSLQAVSDLSSSTLTVKLGTASLAFTLTNQPRAYSGYITANGVDLEITVSGGSNPAFTNVELYEVQSIPSGGLWQLADFGEVFVLANGACTLFVTNYSQGGFTQQRCFIDTLLNPNTVTNMRGRLLMGGFQGADSWAAAWDTFWGTVASAAGTTGMPTENLSARHLWWSSIGGEDMLQYFLPETLLEKPGTTTLDQEKNILLNGDFRRAGNGWTLSSGWTAETGYLEHTPGTTDTAEQDATRMGLVPVLGDIYEVTITVEDRTVGTVSVYLGTALAVTASGGTFYLGRAAFTDSTLVTIEASSGFDGKVTAIAVRPVVGTGAAEDIWLLGEQGQRALPWQGAVLAQHPFASATLVGTADGIAAFSPAGSTLGLTLVHSLGLAGRGALAGSQREALFVDRAGTIWRIGSDLSLTREGREEFLAPLLGGQGPVIHYNTDRDEYLIAFAGNKTFVVSRTGVGELATSVFALPQLEGTYRYIADAAFTTSTVTLETDTIDFGSRGKTTLKELEACFDGSDLSLTLLNRMGTNDAWKEIGPFTFQEAGRLIRSFSQTELKIRLTFPTLTSFTRFSYLRLHAQQGGQGALADTLSLNNLL
jgi:hypothetical protein